MRTCKPFVDCIGLTLIGFAHPFGEVAAIFLDDFAAAIGRPTVDNDIFQMRIILAQHRINRFFEIPGLIERRGNDGY